MSNILKIVNPVLEKIEELGPTKAATYFGKSKPTMFAWRKNPDSIPCSAVQKVTDEAESNDKGLGQPLGQEAPDDGPITASLPEPVVPTVQVIGARPQSVPTPLPSYGDFVADVQKRLDRLENYARMMTDPDLNTAQRTSLLRPAAPPQRTDPAATVVTPAVPLEQIPVDKDPNSPTMATINRPRPQWQNR